jgi:membrane fusion protein (multidrug efflux system)
MKIGGTIPSNNTRSTRRRAGTLAPLIYRAAHDIVKMGGKDELGRVHPSQPVTLTSDLYWPAVTFHARVIGQAGGSGAAFTVIPMENPTDNRISVT